MKLRNCAALFPVLSLAAPVHQERQARWAWNGTNSVTSAVYFLRVDPAGSTIVGIDVSAEGLLTPSTTSVSTAGVGLQSQNYTNDLLPVGVDPLQGQGSVAVGDDYLFTINSGSNTAVMFEINPENPLDLQIVGSPVPSLGEYPMSITYSSKYSKACVLNGGAINGVACYSVSSEGLEPDGVGLRSFGYPSTTPPQLGGPQGSGSDIQFSIDSSELITTFKGQNTPVTLGHISVFDVSPDGDIASTWTDNQVEPIQGPFGFALSGYSASEIYVTDVSFGGALVSLDSDTNDISVVSVVNSTSFAASCWAAWSAVTDSYYNVNAASANIGEVDAAGTLANIIDYNSTLGGATDTIASGSTLIYLTVMNVLVVLDIETGELLQQYEYSTASDRPYWTGMAGWPASPVLTGGLGGSW